MRKNLIVYPKKINRGKNKKKINCGKGRLFTGKDMRRNGKGKVKKKMKKKSRRGTVYVKGKGRGGKRKVKIRYLREGMGRCYERERKIQRIKGREPEGRTGNRKVKGKGKGRVEEGKE